MKSLEIMISESMITALTDRELQDFSLNSYVLHQLSSLKLLGGRCSHVNCLLYAVLVVQLARTNLSILHSFFFC